MSPYEIRLVHGTQFLTVAEIPRLIALALNPGSDAEITISYLSKISRRKNVSRPLSPRDQRYLTKLWQPLPKYNDGLNAAAWQPYVNAHQTRTKCPWSLLPIWTNPNTNRQISQAGDEEQHEIYLKRVIRNGALRVFSPSMTPCSASDGTAPFARVLIPDFIRYLESNVPSVQIVFEKIIGPEVLLTDPELVATKAPGTLQIWQEDQIIRTTKSLGFDPLALPPNDPSGKFYVKSLIRERCGKNHRDKMRANVFDKAWERLKASSRLKYLQ